MKILISNDDGIYAPGINILHEALCDIADVTVVAPLTERSATGQTLTLDHPIRVEEIKKGFYGTTGYPADCTLMGIIHILDEKPDLVISGINRGANLGQDIYYSGTAAAARQGSFHDVPSIAVSTVIDGKSHDFKDIHFDTAAQFMRKMVLDGTYKNISPLTMLNINVPNLAACDIEGVKVTKLGQRFYSEEVEKRLDSKNREYFWIGGKFLGHSKEAGTDCYAIDNRQISINPLNLLGDSAEEFSKWTEIFAD
ncbi:MAG: 5'/3'-nucleotidase SurE [Bacteriovorax sp. MedPE-SWde]|nr:MAG: 5'/3'-nucleotidase SurE [Bacteriovorax sp. MedPE-SWde]